MESSRNTTNALEALRIRRANVGPSALAPPGRGPPDGPCERGEWEGPAARHAGTRRDGPAVLPGAGPRDRDRRSRYGVSVLRSPEVPGAARAHDGYHRREVSRPKARDLVDDHSRDQLARGR